MKSKARLRIYMPDGMVFRSVLVSECEIYDKSRFLLYTALDGSRVQMSFSANWTAELKESKVSQKE